MCLNLTCQLLSSFFKNSVGKNEILNHSSRLAKKPPKLQNNLFFSAFFATCLLFSGAAIAQNAVLTSDISEGPKLENPESLVKKYFPDVTRIREQRFVPLNSGGTSFMGLVGRLLGERTDNLLEGIKTRRFIYHAFNRNKALGVAHTSSFNHNRETVDVAVIYTLDGNIADVVVRGLPTLVDKELESGNYLKQFQGRNTEDFEIVRGRKGRIRSRGAFILSHKKPVGALSRGYFDKIVRAVRYNAAFMDVAYFITKHPNLDNESEKVVAEVQAEGPEAFVRNRKTGETRVPSSETTREGTVKE